MVLSFAVAWASPHESPISCSSAITGFRRVVCGRPGFLLLGDVHLRTTLGILSLGILRTCPKQLNRRRLISRTALLQPVFLWSSMLDILLGQNIRQIFLKHPLWKVSIFAMPPTRQHSEPFSKIFYTLLLSSLIFVFMVYLEFHIFWSLANTQRALPSLVWCIFGLQCLYWWNYRGK